LQKNPAGCAGCRSLACVWRSFVLVVIRLLCAVSDEPSWLRSDPHFLSIIPWPCFLPSGCRCWLIHEQHSCQRAAPGAPVCSRRHKCDAVHIAEPDTVTRCTLCAMPPRLHFIVADTERTYVDRLDSRVSKYSTHSAARPDESRGRSDYKLLKSRIILLFPGV
jgi:hypothetical protein